MKFILSMFVLSFCLVSNAIAADTLRLFNDSSYQQIREQNKQQPFLLVLWSIECPPCMEELSMLAKLYQQNSDLKIMLISTDSMQQSEEIEHVLQTYGVGNLPVWVFSDESRQSLRFSIDPQWYGELPRSYFHAQGKRKAFSGKLNMADVINWFKSG